MNLRPLLKTDLLKRLAMTNDRELERLSVGDITEDKTLADLENWFETLASDRRSRQLAIETREGSYVGDLDIHGIDPNSGEAWIAPFFGREVIENPEILRDAVETAARYARGELGVKKLSVEVLDINEVALKVFRALGFTRSGEIDHLTGVRSILLESNIADLTV